ncbi:MAG: gfo/Idh/MocA family oxidoreductase [Candidatus Omnitrophota bacterium]|jgi:predicted dehydrogenase|nr:MAG: gfo/Idh/MocA family oxidoreductase [Candidatus Omnitrophota bacterium]
MTKKIEKTIGGKESESLNRRTFIAGAGASTLAFSIIQPQFVMGTSANTKIKLGLIGCGGRGAWISNLFVQNGGYEIVAAFDYFADRVNAYGERFHVSAAHCFSGLSGYKRLLADGVDAVAIETPPYFHPEQAAAGVDAGVHVYVAKPIAVDAPGCETIAASGKKATEKRLCFLVDFQTRANEFYIEAIRRVHAGDIGNFAFGESSYHAGCPWDRQFQYLEDDPANPENRLRAWGLDKTLSGDIITEQNIHTLDVASWIMNEPPLQASGLCARKVRKDLGNCHDCFTVVFEYPNDVGISFSSRQFEGHESAGGINNRMFGSKGVLETQYGGQVLIRGEHPYPGGKTPQIFTEGAVNNIATFRNNIVNGVYDNPTVEPSVRSNLVAILGRTAAYTRSVVRWNEMLKTKEKLEFDLTGLND